MADTPRPNDHASIAASGEDAGLERPEADASTDAGLDASSLEPGHARLSLTFVATGNDVTAEGLLE